MIWIRRKYSRRKDCNSQSYAETETVQDKAFGDEIDKVGVERKFKEIINLFLRLHRISNDRYNFLFKLPREIPRSSLPFQREKAKKGINHGTGNWWKKQGRSSRGALRN